jgi:hypothetical protein
MKQFKSIKNLILNFKKHPFKRFPTAPKMLSHVSLSPAAQTPPYFNMVAALNVTPLSCIPPPPHYFILTLFHNLFFLSFIIIIIIIFISQAP